MRFPKKCKCFLTSLLVDSNRIAGDSSEYDLLFYQLSKVKKSILESVKIPKTLFYRMCDAECVTLKEL